MEEIEVWSVQKIPRTTSGEYTYVVILAFESPIIQKIERGETTKKAEIDINIPGIQTRAPTIPLENKIILFLNEKEWQKCQKKFVVGKRVSLKVENDGSIKLR